MLSKTIALVARPATLLRDCSITIPKREGAFGSRIDGHTREGPRRCHLTGLAIEIVAVLVVKTVALALIWWVSFSEPIAPSMRLEPDVVTRQLLATTSIADQR